jgi:hypothetical protein
LRLFYLGISQHRSILSAENDHVPRKSVPGEAAHPGIFSPVKNEPFQPETVLASLAIVARNPVGPGD